MVKLTYKKLTYKELERLAAEMYEHLGWCGWGDQWERECSEDLRERAEHWAENLPEKVQQEVLNG